MRRYFTVLVLPGCESEELVRRMYDMAGPVVPLQYRNEGFAFHVDNPFRAQYARTLLDGISNIDYAEYS